MELPFEMLIGFFFLTVVLAIIGLLKKAPYLMFIGGAMLTFLFILTDSVTALGGSQTCITTSPNTTTCTFEPYTLDAWVKILFCLLGSLFMIAGALIWKTEE